LRDAQFHIAICNALNFDVTLKSCVQIFLFPFCHTTPPTQAQTEERAERSWKLRDMLHLAKLTEMAMNDYCFNRGASAAVSMQATPVTHPTLVGKGNFSRVEINAGLWVAPKEIALKAKAYLPE
jgi:hypothetical protein